MIVDCGYTIVLKDTGANSSSNCILWPANLFSSTPFLAPFLASNSTIVSSSMRSLFYLPPRNGSKHSVSVFLCRVYPSPWCPPGPSPLPQITRFHSFHGWILAYCIYGPHFLYPVICQGAIPWPTMNPVVRNRNAGRAGTFLVVEVVTWR